MCTSIYIKNINQDRNKPSSNLWQWIISIGKQDVCETVAGFNQRHESEHRLPFFKSKKEREILIIDDSQRLSPDELSTLLGIADKRAAKVILLEKSHALSFFKSDIPGLLDKAQIKTFEVDDKDTQTSNINLIEVKKQEDRILKTAEMFCSQDVKTRINTRVLTVSKSEAQVLNEAIRTQLKKQGELSTAEKIINTLTRISLTESEKKWAKSYEKDWVLIQKTRTESKKFTIIGVNEQDNQLVVRQQNGMISTLSTKNMTQTMQVYEQTALSVGVGDKLLATGSLSFEGVKMGTHYEVSAFTRHGVKIKNGKQTIHLMTSSDKHIPLSYAYAKTMHSHEFKPVARTIITLPSYALRQNTMSLLAESSKEELSIVTEDVTKANRYAKKANSPVSAISLAIDAAKTHYGAHLIDSATSSELLITLEQAINLLSSEKPIKNESEKALQLAIAHCSEREAAFSRAELLKVALNKAIGKSDFRQLDEMLEKALEKGELLSGMQGMLTTKEAVAFEQAIINTVKNGINTLNPLMNKEEAHNQLAQSKLTQGQQEACELILTTTDQFVMIQGYAGTGKTTMTRTAIEMVKEAQSLASQGFDIIAVAPTHQAVKEMKALGIQAQTLKSFLIEQEQELTLTKQSLVLLDESSMVSNRDCAKLIGNIYRSGARCAVLGDISQHQSIEAGKPSKILMQEGSISVAGMDNLVRQRIEGYKIAIETLISGDTDKALNQLGKLPLDLIKRNQADSPFHTLESSVIEAGSLLNDESKPMSPISAAVGDYLSRTPDCRDKTIIIIHENKKREVANHKIREALIKESALGSENKSFPRLLSTDYTTEELYYCETYRDCLNKAEPHFLKKENQYFKVVGVDESAKVVILHDMQGNKTVFIPEKEQKDWKIELFRSSPGALSVGEKIHFKKSDKSLGRFANERLQVVDVQEHAYTVKDDSGVEHVLQKKEMNDAHWDYSYTATSYSIQGASSPYVIGVAETTNKKLNHLRSFYIMVTRGSLHAMVYTDDYSKMKKQLKNSPDKTSALEALAGINNSVNLKTKSSASITTDSNYSRIEIKKETTAIKSEQCMGVAKNKVANKLNTKDKMIHYNAKIISKNLSNNTELVVESLLGHPNKELSSKKEYRYGINGSLSICLSGEKRGTWFNFETLEKGNMLHLIQKTCSLNFKESLAYAAKITGDDLKESIKNREKLSMNSKEKRSNQHSKTKDYAFQLAHESMPIRGTIAEKYLKEIRKIDNVSGENIRFHPRVYTKKTEKVKYRPALLSLSRDKERLY